MKHCLALFSFLFVGCLALTSLEEQIVSSLKEAKKTLENRHKNVKEDTWSMQSQRANKASQKKQERGDLLQEATRILVNKYGTGILSQVSDVNMEPLMKAANV